jgi:transcriptional regulator with XRE-family HTH domain
MQLRQQVRDAREARELTVRTLADELGMTHTTLKFVLYCRQPPSRSLQKRLTDWLAAATEVAAVPAEPFRPNGAGYAADTSDDAEHLAA